MKKTFVNITSSMAKKISVLLATFLFSLYSIAQETKDIDVDISTDGGSGNFFTQPWVWIVGGAVFILLLVALLRNNKR